MKRKQRMLSVDTKFNQIQAREDLQISAKKVDMNGQNGRKNGGKLEEQATKQAPKAIMQPHVTWHNIMLREASYK